MPTEIFFSYSHKDRKWLEACQKHLKPLIRKKEVAIWDDTKIKSGDLWRDEIRRALATAKVAVLLVTPDFLDSDFIAENELPPLLEAAKREGLRILWIAVRPSSYEETEIARYQALNDPGKSLASLKGANREKEFVRICKEIKSAIGGDQKRSASASVLQSIETPIEELSTVRNLAAAHHLIEHVSDSATVRIRHYPTAMSVSHTNQIQNNSDDILVTENQEATLYFKAAVYAVGFYYQQGFNLGSISIGLKDGRVLNYFGKEFFPNMSFFGYYSDQGIQSIHFKTNGRGASLAIRSFYFYSKGQHSRVLPTS